MILIADVQEIGKDGDEFFAIVRYHVEYQDDEFKMYLTKEAAEKVKYLKVGDKIKATFYFRGMKDALKGHWTKIEMHNFTRIMKSKVQKKLFNFTEGQFPF